MASFHFLHRAIFYHSSLNTFSIHRRFKKYFYFRKRMARASMHHPDMLAIHSYNETVHAACLRPKRLVQTSLPQIGETLFTSILIIINYPFLLWWRCSLCCNFYLSLHLFFKRKNSITFLNDKDYCYCSLFRIDGL